MNKPPGKKTCEHSDNFTFEAVPDARGKGNSAKKPGKIKLALRIIIWLLFVTSSPFLAMYFLPYLGFAEPAWWTDFLELLRPEEKVAFIPGPLYEGPHTMLFLGGDDPLKSSFVHPLLATENKKEKQWDNFRVMSAREGDILKVVVREITESDESSPHPWEYWHIYDPGGRDFAGMAARYFSSGSCEREAGIIFEDGSVLCLSNVPPGSIRIGTSAHENEMRWRRFWKDYYLVAVYRGDAMVIDEWLMREKDGKNIGMILGESNLKDIDNSFGIYGSWDGQGIDIGAIGISERYRLVPVTLEEMENLPPDFPRHLLRGWQ